MPAIGQSVAQSHTVWSQNGEPGPKSDIMKSSISRPIFLQVALLGQSFEVLSKPNLLEPKRNTINSGETRFLSAFHAPEMLVSQCLNALVSMRPTHMSPLFIEGNTRQSKIANVFNL